MLLFAGLAERAGAREWRLDDVAERSTVGALIVALRERHAALRSVPFAIARNRSLARDAETLEDGDELALLPPVSGG